MAKTPATVTLPAQRWNHERRKALFVAGACWLGFVLVYWLAESGRLADFDRFGLLLPRTGPDKTLLGPPQLLDAVKAITALGSVLPRNLFALGCAIALLFLGFRREAMVFALTVIGAWLFESGIKSLVDRARPEIVPHLTAATGPSFPSGHAFNSATIYLAAALVFAALSKRHDARVTLISLAIVVSLDVAWSRVLLGVHFPSDVLAGWLGGAGWALLAGALFLAPLSVRED